MSAKKAVSPVSDYGFQAMMSKIGYERWADSPTENAVVYKLRPDAPIPHLQQIVTVSKPDYLDHDGVSLAYEKHYVVDLIVTMIGDEDHGTAEATYAAIRDLQ